MMTKLTGRLFLALLFAAASTAAFAQSGKIAGKVTDAENGEALIGASVLVVGTSLGAATDFDGNYNILNVPPGVYTIRISYVGYTNKTISNIRVSTGLTARIDVQLSAEVLTLGEEITVVAEKPMVQKDQTASTAIVSGDQIAALPVTEVSQVVSLSAGNVGGHFRGGRSGEVGYMIDGVPVTDKFDGSASVDVNKNMVSELQVISGAFNAEYGQAMSAIVNVTTKDGSNKYEGSVSTYFGDYLTNHDDIFPKPETFNPLNIQNYEASLSGPIFKDKLYFFLVGRWVDFGGHLYGERRFNPDNIVLPNNDQTYTFTSPGDKKLVQMNSSKKWSTQSKLTYPISTNLKTTLNVIYENREWQNYDNNYRYNPDGLSNSYQNSLTTIASFTHTITASTFYTVSGSGFFKNYESYYKKGKDNILHPTLATVNANSFSTGGSPLGEFERSTSSFTLKGDLWSQVNNEHQIKAGLEFKNHIIDYYYNTPMVNESLTSPYVNGHWRDGSDPDKENYGLDPDGVYYDEWTRKPIEFAAYAQDKIEFSNFILNIGLRFDYFDPVGKSPADLTDPNILSPRKDINIYRDENGDGKIGDTERTYKTVAEREKYWWKKSDPKYQFSPRLGAAFPITDKGKVYFSYGHFYQFPNFDLLYRNANYKVSKANGNVGTTGNTDLKPEKNVQMELGLNQQITDNTAIDVTMYFRDYRDLSGTRSDEIETAQAGNNYNRIVNSDFAFIRGVILSLNQRMTDGLALTLDYTFQIAKGTASSPDQARELLNSGRQPDISLVPLSWDQTHTINGTMNYSTKDWGVSSIITFGTGMPYTPRASKTSNLTTNSEVKPSVKRVDLRGYYNVDVPGGHLSFFANVYNLFDTLNEYGVFDDTGRANYSLDYYDQVKNNTEEQLRGVNTLKEYFTIPTMYEEPRRIEFGVSYNF